MTTLSKITMTTLALLSMTAPSFALDTTTTKTITVEVNNLNTLSETDAKRILTKIDRAVDQVCARLGDNHASLYNRREIQRCETEAFNALTKQKQYLTIRNSLEAVR